MTTRPPGQAPAAASRIESQGIDTVPEEQRTYGPRHIFWVLFASDLAFSVIVVGSLPILFGLGWWSTVTAILAGSFVGALALAPMGLFGPKTGTNNAVSSGAHFGVAGRMVGTALALFSALGFVAITIWTGGDALVSGAHRLFGTPDSDGVRAVGYALIAAVVVLIAVRGFHLLVRVQQRVMAPVVGAVMVIGLFAFAGDFDAGYGGSGEYLLGTFWPTWTLAALVAASTVISYTPFVGDWARYISPQRHRPPALMTATFLGGFLGIAVPALWGAYAASTFGDGATGAFVPDLIATSPGWYVVGLMVIGLIAGCAQGAVGLYGTGLDTSSLIPKLSRVNATLAIATVAVTFVYVGNFVWDAASTVSAFLVLLVVVATPWAVIMAIGYWWRRGHYLPDDLQVFTRGETGGRYWFTAGLNLRALGAFLPAAVVGLLFAAAPPLYTGPWANAADGIDLSFLSAGVIGGALYLILLVVFPEPAEVFGPEGPRFGRRPTQDDAADRPLAQVATTEEG